VSKTLEEDLSLQKRFCYLEWIAIVLIILTQLGWVLNVVQFDWRIDVSFALLILALPLAAIMPQSNNGRFIALLMQTAVIFLAGALGAHRQFSVYFLVLATKAAASLSRKQMLIIAGLLIVSRITAGALSQYLTHHVYLHRPSVSTLYTSLVTEAEFKLYFIIGLVAVLFLGRTVVAERKSRKAQEKLAEQAEKFAIEVERNKIARDIDDSLAHTLASEMIQLELAIRLVEENKLERARDIVSHSYDSAVRCLQEVRRAVKDMRKVTGIAQTESGPATHMPGPLDID
jgi:signal transduction histidine kinase